MTLKYNAALRELTNAAPEEILAKVAAVKAVQQEILAAQPELAVVDGAYQIGTPGDLVTFANLMNAGGEGLLSSAVLTDDIEDRILTGDGCLIIGSCLYGYICFRHLSDDGCKKIS